MDVLPKTSASVNGVFTIDGANNICTGINPMSASEVTSQAIRKVIYLDITYYNLHCGYNEQSVTGRWNTKIEYRGSAMARCTGSGTGSLLCQGLRP